MHFKFFFELMLKWKQQEIPATNLPFLLQSTFISCLVVAVVVAFVWNKPESGNTTICFSLAPLILFMYVCMLVLTVCLCINLCVNMLELG